MRRLGIKPIRRCAGNLYVWIMDWFAPPPCAREGANQIHRDENHETVMLAG